MKVLLTFTDFHVLLLGETGGGKEYFAQFIHHLGPRAHRPMLTVNCSSIPENLVESQLFGHKKGALTAATITEIVRYPWPGNVRELRRVIQQSAMRTPGKAINPEDLRFEAPMRTNPMSALPDPSDGFKMNEFLDEIKLHLIRRARELGGFAEAYAHSDPASCLVKLRTFAEFLVKALFSHQRLTAGWRVPESSLHLAELLGGWPGAPLA